MCKISVLMSIYNENDREIFESINSILNQTVRDFELIIVVDNPDITMLGEHLKEIGITDNRIRIIYNHFNIGLAESMNKALAASKGMYIARMDADDIALPSRFQEEVTVLDDSYDLVCTDYMLIDEKSEIIERPTVSYSMETLEKDLKYGNIIHHPTVMMRREILEKVDGYRNFPCAQDYDLWLRILEEGGRFAIINKPLLKYRLRGNSITESKSFKQVATIWYIQKLCKERKKLGKDSFSQTNYNKYLENLHLDDISYVKKCEIAKEYKKHIDEIKTVNRIKAMCMIIQLAAVNPFYRRLYYHNFKEVVGMKRNKKKAGKNNAKYKNAD